MKQLSQYVLDWWSCQKCQSLCWLFPIYVILCISKATQLNIPTLMSDIQSSRKFEMKNETCRHTGAKNFDKAQHSHIIADIDIKSRQIFQINIWVES